MAVLVAFQYIRVRHKIDRLENADDAATAEAGNRHVGARHKTKSRAIQQVRHRARRLIGVCRQGSCGRRGAMSARIVSPRQRCAQCTDLVLVRRTRSSLEDRRSQSVPFALCQTGSGSLHTAVRFSRATSANAMQEMKSRVGEYFAARNLSSKANGAMVAKTCVVLAITFVPYVLILTNRFSTWTMLGLAIVMGVGMAGIGFNIAHDALHGAYSANVHVNRALGFSFDVLGASSYMWKITHNIVHHTYTNIEGVDEDLAVSPLLRLSPHARRYWFHRFQHFYALPLYGLTTLFWVFVKDYGQLLRRDLGPYRDKEHDGSNVAVMVATKLSYYTYALLIPLAVLHIPWWQTLIGFAVMHVTAGLVLGVVFQLAHVVEATDYPLPDDRGAIEADWWLHEMQTTADFARSSRLVSWYVGGLNHQIEHHLFPKVCSIHYPAISAIVQDVARKYGLPYHDQPTLLGALGSHLRSLREFGVRQGAAVAAASGVGD
jgi:linoleoyl-CoA desaturase